MPAASRRHFVRPRAITIARVMPAAGGLALRAAQGNYYFEGDACGRGGWHFVRPKAITIARVMPAAGGLALRAAQGNYCCVGEGCCT